MTGGSLGERLGIDTEIGTDARGGGIFGASGGIAIGGRGIAPRGGGGTGGRWPGVGIGGRGIAGRGGAAATGVDSRTSSRSSSSIASALTSSVGGSSGTPDDAPLSSSSSSSSSAASNASTREASAATRPELGVGADVAGSGAPSLAPASSSGGVPNSF